VVIDIFVNHGRQALSAKKKSAVIAGIILVLGMDLIIVAYYLTFKSNFFTGISTGEFYFEPLGFSHLVQAIVVNLIAFGAGFWFRLRMFDSR
jgi:hypothetical protein